MKIYTLILSLQTANKFTDHIIVDTVNKPLVTLSIIVMGIIFPTHTLHTSLHSLQCIVYTVHTVVYSNFLLISVSPEPNHIILLSAVLEHL